MSDERVEGGEIGRSTEISYWILAAIVDQRVLIPLICVMWLWLVYNLGPAVGFPLVVFALLAGLSGARHVWDRAYAGKRALPFLDRRKGGYWHQRDEDAEMDRLRKRVAELEARLD